MPEEKTVENTLLPERSEVIIGEEKFEITALVRAQYKPLMGVFAEVVMAFDWDLLDDIEEMGNKEGVKVRKELKEGIPDDEIIKLAGKKDLIVMGSKGKTALDRIFLGSVSEKVLHHADSSILIIK